MRRAAAPVANIHRAVNQKSQTTAKPPSKPPSNITSKPPTSSKNAKEKGESISRTQRDSTKSKDQSKKQPKKAEFLSDEEEMELFAQLQRRSKISLDDVEWIEGGESNLSENIEKKSKGGRGK